MLMGMYRASPRITIISPISNPPFVFFFLCRSVTFAVHPLYEINILPVKSDKTDFQAASEKQMKTTPVKTKQEAIRQKAETWLDRLYFFAAFFLLPLVIRNGYLDITETKTLFFVIVSCVYLLGRAVCFIQFRAPGEKPALPREPEELAAVCFCFISLLGSVSSGFFRDSVLGTRGRWQGTAIFVLYAALFFTVGRRRVREKDVLVPLCGGLFLSSLLAVVNHLGSDPLGIIGQIDYSSRGSYISTLGNINFAGAYISLILPAAAWYLLNSERRGERWILGAVCTAGLWAAMAVRSESAVLGVGAGMLALPFTLRREGGALRRWGALAVGLAAAMQLYRAVVWLSGGRFSALTRAALHPAAAGAVLLVGAAWYWLLRKNPGREQKALRIYGRSLAACFLTAVILLVLLNTVWREAELGAAAAWLRFSDSWGTDRVMVWRHSLGFYREFILWDKLFGGGCGVLAALDAARRLFPDAVLDTAHCEYLQILLNWGALGLTAYAGWLGLTAVKAFRKGSRLAMASAAGLIAYAVQASVNIAQAPGITLFFLLLAIQRSDAGDGTQI